MPRIYTLFDEFGRYIGKAVPVAGLAPLGWLLAGVLLSPILCLFIAPPCLPILVFSLPAAFLVLVATRPTSSRRNFVLGLTGAFLILEMACCSLLGAGWALCRLYPNICAAPIRIP